MKINLGCGRDYKEGYINVDQCYLYNCELHINLEKKLPFKDNSIDEIYASHILEHVIDLKGLLEEIYRISKNGTIFIMKVPHYSRAFADAFHYHGFSYKWYSALDYVIPHFKYEVLSTKLTWSIWKNNFTDFLNIPINFLANSYIGLCERFWCSYVGGFDELEIKFKIIKR